MGNIGGLALVGLLWFQRQKIIKAIIPNSGRILPNILPQIRKTHPRSCQTSDKNYVKLASGGSWGRLLGHFSPQRPPRRKHVFLHFPKSKKIELFIEIARIEFPWRSNSYFWRVPQNTNKNKKHRKSLKLSSHAGKTTFLTWSTPLVDPSPGEPFGNLFGTVSSLGRPWDLNMVFFEESILTSSFD